MIGYKTNPAVQLLMSECPQLAAVSMGRRNTSDKPLCQGFDPLVRGQLVLNRR